MGNLYGMRRANGDWFAFIDHGRLSVPVYRNRDDAQEAHARNPGMLLFRPTILDERMLAELSAAGGQEDVCFLLAGGASRKTKRDEALGIGQLSSLVRAAARRPKGPGTAGEETAP